MKNLKVRLKILAAFGLVLLLTVGIGITSIVSISTMGSTADNYVNISIPATQYLLEARRNIRLFQVDILESISVETEEKYNEVLAEMETHRTEFYNQLDEFIKLDPQFADEVEEIHNLMDNAISVRQQILDEASKRTAEGNAAAFRIYEDSYFPALEQVTDKLGNLSDELDSAIQERHNSATITQTVVTIIIIAVIAIAVAIVIVITIVLSKAIVAPLKEIQEAMENISNGRISEAKVDYHSNDELGYLAHSARKTVTFFHNVIPDIALLCNNIGDGNFDISTQHHEYYVGETDEILKSIRYVRNSLSGTIEQVDVTAEQLFSGAEQVAEGAQVLAQGSTEQASSVEELSATLMELSGRVDATANNAQVAQTYTDEAVVSIKESTQYMEELITAMNDINNSSNEISQIINTIEDISFQTNILALNAAIEAARAGEAGKGFAVVADEVKNLANKSAEATHHTTELIENALRAVELGMSKVNETSAALNNVVEKEELMSEKVHEITQATVEQSDAIRQINVGVEQISNVVQNNSATSEQSAAAAEQLTGQANMLKELVSGFKLYRQS